MNIYGNNPTYSCFIQTGESDYTKKHREEFCKTLSKLINEVVIPKYGMGLIFSIEMGLFTSGEYGSYRIPFKRKETNEEVCYIVADTIMGEWKAMKNDI
jgi:hypothetical protein